MPAPSAEQELVCYRVAQEALTNVARHARATHVTLEVGVHEDRLRLTVRDDGAGFDPAEMRRRAQAGGSLGLLSLEERAALGGGTLEIDSAPGRGTTLVLTLPVSAAVPGPADAPARGAYGARNRHRIRGTRAVVKLPLPTKPSAPASMAAARNSS